MKAKLIIEGKEFEVDINNSELEKLIKPEKKTGYERVKYKEKYYSICIDNTISSTNDGNYRLDDNLYDIANYYSDKTVAKNNARADKLMRQLRRFAVEHRKEKIDWTSPQLKHYIVYDCGVSIGICHTVTTRGPGVVYFDSVEAANDAIKTFHDELIWYFTEYKNSL